MKIHFIGIGGIGASGLAGFCLSKGHEVSGSDLSDSQIIKALKKQGAKIFVGPHDSANLTNRVDLVVYTAAATPDNPELKKAKKLGIKCQSYAEALGDLTKRMFTIAVSGMHGKSTTTAMLALVLEKAGLDPTVIVGTRLREWGNRNFRVGKSKYLVIEADEYNASFLNYWPQIIVLTNIEEEHLDYYKDLKHIMAVFKKYVSHLRKGGVLVANGDDSNISKLEFQNAKPQFKIQNYSMKQLEFERLGKVLKVTGEHNISNALAVLTVARILKIPDKITYGALSRFRGTWRRMEYKGLVNGAKIYDDYGHHPTEIKATLRGARESLKNGRLWIIFQPHQYQRTYKLFNQFANAFNDADRVILLPIYSVAGRERESIKKKVSSEKLIDAMHKLIPGRRREILCANSFQRTKDYLKKELRKNDICIIMGAGDAYKLTELLVKGGKAK